MRALRNPVRAIAVAACLALAAASVPAVAAQTANRVDAKKDWSVFTAETDGKVCWVVTQPTRSTARRGGKPVSVRRGDIYLMVSVRPTKGVKNEVSFLAGYPFRPGSNVEAKVGSNEFTLYTDGEAA